MNSGTGFKFLNEDLTDTSTPKADPNQGSKPTDARPNPDVTPADRGEGLTSVLPDHPVAISDDESVVDKEHKQIEDDVEQIEGLDEGEGEEIEGLD